MSSKNKIHFRLPNTKNDYTDYRTGDYEVFDDWIYEVIDENSDLMLICSGICDKTGKEVFFRSVHQEISIKKNNKLNRKLYSDYLFEEGGYIVIRK